jgi:cytochrome c oxidase subunit 2
MTGRARLLSRVVPMAFGLAVIATGCAEKDHPQTTLRPKGPEARTIHHLIMPVFGVAGIVFVLILGGALFVAIKFRARDDADFDEFPAQVHGNFKMEIAWTILPAIILGVIGLLTVFTVLDLAKKPDEKALQVQVIGQQWWWEYRYDTNGDGIFSDHEVVTANDLVIPAGRKISLHIRSRDVIHSWWSPALNGKRDAVPGRIHPLTIQAQRPGEYIGQCTEYCGLSHAEMRIKVVALSPADYETWMQGQKQHFANPSTDEAIAGWKVFASQCTSCHRIEGLTDPGNVNDSNDLGKASKAFTYPKQVNQVSGAAPNLTHLMSRTMFAGGKFNLRKKTKFCDHLGEDWAASDKNLAACLNRKDLEAWIRNAPAMKAMAPGDVMNPDSRGMPNFNLTEDQIDQLVAFLTTLK